ncbi:hypothetical protein BHE74_00031216 [Ensete ventricosum]|nr:hypothetical protein BHE74_00031216 [Ensete ventricosum]RZR89312.1 hypothetical protein BHM03_00017006 [Ensete ventricosum]
MAVDFDGYISLVEKEQMILLEPRAGGYISKGKERLVGDQIRRHRNRREDGVSAARWRPTHCGVDKGSNGQERPGEATGGKAAVADGIAERGRRITPSKDDDEQPQEGAMCGRWGGAATMDRLLQKIGDDEGCREMSSDLERNQHWRQRVAWRMMLLWLGIKRRVDHSVGRVAV